MGSSFTFKYSVIWESIPVLLQGVKYTIYITVLGLLIGFALGAVAGIAKTTKSRIINYISGFYIESIRGTPLMVQVMFVYFGLPLAFGVRISPMVAGVGAIAINSGAYIAEIVRGGNSVHR